MNREVAPKEHENWQCHRSAITLSGAKFCRHESAVSAAGALPFNACPCIGANHLQCVAARLSLPRARIKAAFSRTCSMTASRLL